MGVNPTPSNFKTFTFDNTNSAQYGVYITGQGVFNAPERNVEMVEIPGRDGAYALDKGNFNNIEVTYPAGIVADTEADFATAVSNLRNFLCSKTGYCRLTDDYNSGEYRMAIYKSGLDVDHEGLKTGQFDLVFECKPQRWLTSGETAVSVANGGTVTNPTLFDSSPLLQTKGYGHISFNGYTLEVENVVLGDILITDNDNISTSSYNNTIGTYYIEPDLVNSGDTINVSTKFSIIYDVISSQADKTASNVITDSNANFISTSSVKGYQPWPKRYFLIDINTSANCAFTIGTPATQQNIAQAKISTDTNYLTITESIAYTQPIENGVQKNKIVVSYSSASLDANYAQRSTTFSATTTINAQSTVLALGDPTYIDCDIGECYMIQNNEIISLNNVVRLGGRLPMLANGNNTINYDNTFTKVEIVPRWWKV